MVVARAAVLTIVVTVAISARREAAISAIAVIRHVRFQVCEDLAALPRDRAVIGALRAVVPAEREEVVQVAKLVLATAHLRPRALA